MICCDFFVCLFFELQGGQTSSVAMKKQSSDWSSSGWDADDSWSNEKDTDGQGQSSPADEGWGNDWEDDGALAESFAQTPHSTALSGSSGILPKTASASSGQEGLRLTSEYNWDSSGAKGTTSDLFSGMSQRAGSASAAVVRRLTARMFGEMKARYVYGK